MTARQYGPRIEISPRALVRIGRDWLIRRRFRRHLAELPLDRFTVRIAHTVEEHEDAFRLVRVAYAYEGIQSIRGPEMRMIQQHVLPEATVFVAYEGDRLVATMTATLDSPAGVPLDHDYPGELDALRAGGSRLVEYGSLAVVRRCWRSGVTTLLNMAAHWFSLHVLRATHCVVGINPKIASWYSALFAFRALASAHPHNELIAPVVPLLQDFEQARRHFRRYFSHPQMQSGALPYEHFVEQLPSCIEMPPCSTLAELVRWKLPREVFRELFLHRSDHLSLLDPATRARLTEWRSLRTTRHLEMASKKQPRVAG